MSEYAVRLRCGDFGKGGGVWEVFDAMLMGFTQTHEGLLALDPCWGRLPRDPYLDVFGR